MANNSSAETRALRQRVMNASAAAYAREAEYQFDPERLEEMKDRVAELEAQIDSGMNVAEAQAELTRLINSIDFHSKGVAAQGKGSGSVRSTTTVALFFALPVWVFSLVTVASQMIAPNGDFTGVATGLDFFVGGLAGLVALFLLIQLAWTPTKQDRDAEFFAMEQAAIHNGNLKDSRAKSRNARILAAARVGMGRGRRLVLTWACLALLSHAIIGVGFATIPSHYGPLALKTAPDSSSLAMQDPAAAGRVADMLSAQAKAALTLASSRGKSVGASWLQERAIAAATPSATPSLLAGLTFAGGVHATSSARAFLNGVWMPAGLWVTGTRTSPLDNEFTVVGDGGYFIPFYADAKCSVLMPDTAARDHDWLVRHTALAGRYTSESAGKEIELSNASASPENAVGCVGAPIAFKGGSLHSQWLRELMPSVYLRVAAAEESRSWSNVFAVGHRDGWKAGWQAAVLKLRRMYDDSADLTPQTN